MFPITVIASASAIAIASAIISATATATPYSRGSIFLTTGRQGDGCVATVSRNDSVYHKWSNYDLIWHRLVPWALRKLHGNVLG